MPTVACLLLLAGSNLSGLRPTILQDPPQTPVKDKWVQQSVNLYYFQNPVVLAKTLNQNGVLEPNPNGAEKTADPTSADATPPKSLPEALGEHIDALNAIERNKQAVKVQELRLKRATEAERTAMRRKLDADRAVNAMNPAIAEAQAQITKQEESVGEAEEQVKTYGTEPPNPPGETPEEKKERLRNLASWKSKLSARKAALASAQRRKEELEYQQDLKELDQTAAIEDLGRATSEKSDAISDLATAKATAEGSLDTVATKVRELRKARAKAQADAANRLDAFAKQREKTPIWRSMAVEGATDPVQRVDIFVYPDSRSLFLRGAPDDVRYVREIIAAFDRPTPQARVTLWTLDLNLIGNKGRNALSTRSTDIEYCMTLARNQMSRVSELFRDAVGDQVAFVEKANRDGLEDRLDGLRLARSFFYQDEVAMQLGLDLSLVKCFPEYYYFTRWTIPDPASTTTLGESILIYLMAKKPHRRAIDDLFRAKLLKDPIAKGFTPDRFMTVIGLGNNATADTMNAYQAEITRALKRSALDRFIDKSPEIVKIYSDFGEKLGLVKMSFLGRLHPGVDPFTGVRKPGAASLDPQQAQKAWLSTLGDINVRGPESLAWQQAGISAADQAKYLGVAEATAYLAPALLWLRQEFGISVQVFEDLSKALREKVKGLTGDSLAEANQRFTYDTYDAFRRSFPTDQSNARIAAADEMLKRIMISLEDDLQDKYVITALNGIKGRLQSSAISVGAIDRTSVIATNRYAARIEGTASAELDLAGQERLLDMALSLTDLITAAKGANLPQMLRKLSGFDQEPTGEFYAVNSGTQFRITPIFDPSGQALSFQFDHVKNSNVLDSDGTNPTLPRVDSHTASMTVQVSNMEIRELTRFETNVKLGMPEKRWGGIPFLNSIYPLSEIPIIGWFSRRNGRDAVSQTSIIYAQNAMYPTIGDLSNLLSSGFGVPPLSH